jgi:hypothetical protein
MRKFRCLMAMILISALAGGCERAARAPDLPQVPTAPDAVPVGSVVFDIDSEASEVRILVYRGGALARLGHNHVIRVRNLSGRAWLHRQSQRAGFEMAFPVEQLQVDLASARAQAGAQFSAAVPEADRESTRRNMLGPAVLDAARHPLIRLRGMAGDDGSMPMQFRVSITLRGVERTVPVSAQVDESGGRLTARGVFELRQTDFGIQPFSVMGGLLMVEDRLDVQFEIQAFDRSM